MVTAGNGKLYGLNDSMAYEIPLDGTGSPTQLKGLYKGGITAAGNGKLYGLYGQAGSYTAYEISDKDPVQMGGGKFTSIVAGNGKLYGISGTAAWEITNSSPGYKQLGKKTGFTSLAAGSDKLYGLLPNGQVWEFTEGGWSPMATEDSSGGSVTFGAITAGGGKLYGLPNNTGWTRGIYEIESTVLTVQGNAGAGKNYKTVVAGNDAVYSTDDQGYAWKITSTATVPFGKPASGGAGIFEVLCTDNSCPSP